MQQNGLQDTNHLVTRNVMRVAFLLVAVKVIAALKEILLARTFGVGPLMDAYQFIFQLAGWGPSIFLAVCSAVLVPAYASLRSQSQQQLTAFRAQVLGATLLLSLLLALVWVSLCLQSDWISHWSGLQHEALAHASTLALPMGLMIIIGMHVALLTAEGIAARLHDISLLEAMPALVLIATLLLAASYNDALLLMGTLAGALVHLFVLAVYDARRIGLVYPSFRFNHPQWRPVIAALFTLLIAQLLQATTSIVDQFWASRGSNGAISVMSYANRLLFVAVGIGATAITRVVLPLLTDLSIQHRSFARRKAMQWAVGMFMLSSVGVMVLWPVSSWIVMSVFERGAFGAEDTRRVAEFLQYSWLQLPPTLAALVLIQLVLAQSHYRILAICAGFNLLTKLIANAELVPYMGVNGLALSTAIMHTCNLFLLFIWWRFQSHD